MNINIYSVFVENSRLSFSGERLATLQDLKNESPDELSIWGALGRHEWVRCSDGFFPAREFQPDDSPNCLKRVARVFIFCGGEQLFQKGLQTPDGYMARNVDGISETFQQGENPWQAANRGLLEELGLSAKLTFVGVVEETKPSLTTGIISDYEFWDFCAEISTNQKEWIHLEKEESKGRLFLGWR